MGTAQERRPVACTATVRGGRIRLPNALLEGLKLQDGDQILFFVNREKPTFTGTPLAAAASSFPAL